jgi:beta-mannosidase
MGLSDEGDTQWLPATVPGCIHTDLMNNGKIVDPFYRTNEKQLQWIDKKDWKYHCIFSLDSSKMMHNQAFLYFKGLDTYAKVTLNGQCVLDANNMFREWKVDVKELLLLEKNILEIEFISPVNIGLEKLEALGYGLPAANDLSELGELGDKKVSVFTRKAPYHYGWDWGPRFVTSGIWRPVELVLYDEVMIDNIFYKQSLIDESEATIDAVAEIQAAIHGNYTITIAEDSDKQPLAEASFDLEPGLNSITIPFKIRNPELWWPNGMGDQHRYHFYAMISRDDIILDTLTQAIGLRSVELVRESDSTGKSFYFSINGKPLLLKGPTISRMITF